MNLQVNVKRFLIIIVFVSIALIFGGCKNKSEVEMIAENIELPNIDRITESFPLPKHVKNNNNASIIWTSNKPNIIIITEFPEWDESCNHSLFYKAKVTLPEEDSIVQLVAEVTYKKNTARKVFDVTVVKNEYQTINIAKVKEFNDTLSKVEVEGIVTFVSKEGYAIKDRTGSIYVYNGHGVNVGDKMIVHGVVDNNHLRPQIVYESQEQIDEVPLNETTEAEITDLKDIQNHDSKDLSFYAKLIKVKGVVKENIDSSNPYKLVNPLNSHEYVLISKDTSIDSIKNLSYYVDKFVEVIALVYEYNDKFSLLIGDDVTGKEFLYTDQQKADLSLAYLIEKWSGMVISENIELDKTVENYGTMVTWQSSNPDILTSEGKVGLSTNDLKVILTIITSTKSGFTSKGTVEVMVKKTHPIKIRDILKHTPKKATDPKVLVLLQGKVVGYQDKGYWVADDTGAILIYNNKENSYEEPYPSIGKMVLIKGELTTRGESYCFTSQVNPIDIMEVTVSEDVIVQKIDISLKQIYDLKVTTYEKATEVASTYYGKFITITGKLINKGDPHIWWVVSESNPDHILLLHNLESNAGLVNDKLVTITVMVKEIFYTNDTDSNVYNQGTFGGVFFEGENIIIHN